MLMLMFKWSHYNRIIHICVNVLMNTPEKYVIDVDTDKMLQTAVYLKKILVQLCLYKY